MLNIKTDKVTIVVNSCDSYEDTWYPFFKIFKAEWPDCKYPIVLNTETKQYSYNDLPITCFQLYKKTEPVSWSQRLIDTLSHIQSDYILFLMDDFFFTDRVDSQEIDFVISQLDSDKSIGVCYLAPMNPIHTTEDIEIDFGGHTGYSERVKIANKWTFTRDFIKPYIKKDLRGLFLVNAQAGLWRKEFLLKTLHPTENAWDWEYYGTLRAYKYNERFISILPKRKAIMPYDYFSGNGIMQGVWVTENVVPLFKKHNIDIDLSIRGIKTKDWNYRHNKSPIKKAQTVFRNIRMLTH